MSQLPEKAVELQEMPTMAPIPTAIGVMPAPAGAEGAGAMPVAIPAAARYNDTFDVFLKNGGLFVSEEVTLLDVLTGHDFSVHAWDPAVGAENPRSGKGNELLYMKEVSSVGDRMFCGSDRPFRMGIVPSSPDVATFHPDFKARDAMFSHPDGMVVERPFKCTCCASNRPVVYMSHNTIGRFATVQNPCTCCAYQYDIHAAHPEDGGTAAVAAGVMQGAGSKWYTVRGSMCQPGVFCFCPCGAASRVRFQIYDGSDAELARPVGEVSRVYPGCCKAMFTEADDFTTTFPADGSPVKRASLISAVILMNYLLYDNDNNNGNRHRRRR